MKNNRWERPAVFCARAAWVLFAVLAAVLSLRFFRLGHGLSRNWATALYALLGLGAGVPLLRGAGRLAERLGRRRALASLLALCLAVKLAWVLLVQIEPAGDYATFWGTAAELAGREVIWGGRYIALFPHVFGYSFFLSLFMKLFGQGALLAPLLNVGLSVLSCWLLFDLADRLFGGRAALAGNASGPGAVLSGGGAGRHGLPGAPHRGGGRLHAGVQHSGGLQPPVRGHLEPGRRRPDLFLQ